jgi:hypothetical protein
VGTVGLVDVVPPEANVRDHRLEGLTNTCTNCIALMVSMDVLFVKRTNLLAHWRLDRIHTF